MPKKYRVLNPRKMPKGTWIVRFGDDRWYEGDVFMPPRGFDKDGRTQAQTFGGGVSDGKNIRHRPAAIRRRV